MRVRVAGGGRAVGGPAGVGDAGEGLQVVRLRVELGHARHAAGALQPAVGIDGDAAGVIAAIFQAAQALDQHRNDIALRHGADDSTHEQTP